MRGVKNPDEFAVRQRTDIKIGDEVTVLPYLDKGVPYEPMQAIVEYINEKHNFYMVRLIPLGVLQSFKMGWAS